MLEITTPFPPSVNHYWFRNRNGTVRVGAAGVIFRQKVCIICRGKKPFEGKIMVRIEVYPPDRRRRDLDNLLKAPLDALQHAGIYADDYQIESLTIVRRSPVKDGSLRIEIMAVD